MTGLPAGIKVELELGGVWTDVTPDVDAMQALQWKIGRTSPFADPAPAMFQVTFANPTGKYTPQRPVLADGVTANPNYPNIDLRIRLRFSYTISAVQYVRAVGYVKQWLPQLGPDGFQSVAVAVTSDRLDQLSRVTLQQSYVQEVLLDSPAAFYTMAEGAGSLALADTVGSSQPIRLATPAVTGYATPIPVPDGLTGLQVPTPGVASITYQAALSVGGAAIKTLESWIAVPGATASTGTVAYGRVQVTDSAGVGNPELPGAVLDGSTLPTAPYMFVDGTPGIFSTNATASVPADGTPHHFVISNDSPGNWSFYLDGVPLGTQASTVPTLTAPVLQLNAQFGGTGAQSVVFGPQAVYTTALSAARVAAHYAAGIGNAGETTGARVARLLSYAGLSPGDINADAGVETLSSMQAIAGKTVLTACQEMAATEGGGSAFYVAPDGRVRFADRRFRRPGSPVLTVDAGADLDVAFAPSYDELTLINSSTVNRQGGTAQTFTDNVSKAKFNLTTDPGGVTTYAATDQAALNLAQWRVRSQAFPSLRLSQVTVDLLTATSASLYQALALVQIGSRIRVTSLDPTASATTYVDLIVEGWTETAGIDQYMVVFDTSPADNPAQAILGDHAYGRAAPDPGAMTLQTTLATSAITTVKIATSSGPTYTTDPTMFPQSISVDTEVITLTAAPSGSSSPQTFTGVLRGQAGTSAVPHTAGAPVNLWPRATATL